MTSLPGSRGLSLWISPPLQLGLVQWRDCFFLQVQKKNRKLAGAVLALIEKQRLGEEIDSGLVKKVVDSFGACQPPGFLSLFPLHLIYHPDEIFAVRDMRSHCMQACMQAPESHDSVWDESSL